MDFYQKNTKKETNRPCLSMTFDNISNGFLKGRNYSLVICSYALHLLDYSKMPHFLWAVSEITDDLLIISPHKRPYIKDTWGWELEEEIVIERVRSRHFSSTIKSFL